MAITAADRTPLHAADLPDAIFGLEVIEDTLPVYDGNIWVRDPLPGEEFPPLRVLLSRSRYWQQDRHLDVIIRLAPPEKVDLAETRIEVRLTAGDNESEFIIAPVPSDQFIFYPRLPVGWTGHGQLNIVWRNDGEILASDSQPFRVESYPESAPRSGRIRIDVPNTDAVTLAAAPLSVGIPLPRGIVTGTDHLRLVDDAGNPVRAQIEELGRWSKFGSTKWLRCDFTADLNGQPRTFFLEYGPTVSRDDEPALKVDTRGESPVVDAGRIRFADGLWFDAAGNGEFVKVVNQPGLTGAFVEHENGRVFRMAAAGQTIIDEHGPNKVVLRQDGWYQEVDGNGEFCKYTVRTIIYRDSPLVRFFFTWYFTGDGNRDRIANMGWDFDLAEGIEPDGFLTAWQPDSWISGDRLLQYNFEDFEVVRGGYATAFPGGRSPGVARAEGNGVRLYFGAKDFWQNYPSELEFRDGSLWFYNWPRHNKPANWSYDPNELSVEEWELNLAQVLYAHQGEMLDFRLPDSIVEDPIRARGDDVRPGGSPWSEEGNPEATNAQGISRTEEMWLLLEPAASPADAAVATLESINDQRLRATVDTHWLASSGVFYTMHPQDYENYPLEEESFALLARAPGKWIERLSTYGMWIYGDHPGWVLGLEDLNPRPYRAFRKSHHGWPYSWLPYARSGDSELLQLADAATRQWIDVAHCHYYSDDVQQRLTDTRFSRGLGYWNTGPVPWAGGSSPATRTMHQKVAHLLYSWHLTNYHRSHDHFLWWADLAKDQGDDSSGIMTGYGRTGVSLLKTFLDTWQATFDPWFIVTAHAIAEGQMARYGRNQWLGRTVTPSDREFHRYTGDEEFREYYLDFANLWGTHRMGGRWLSGLGTPVADINEYAWRITGDDYYIRRVAGAVESLKATVYDGEPDFYRGFLTQPGHQSMATSYWLDQFPLALGAVHEAGGNIQPIGKVFYTATPDLVIAVRKDADTPLTVQFAAQEFNGQADDDTMTYTITGPNETTLTGEWLLGRRIRGETTPRRAGKDVTIPAEAPAGVYRITMDFENPSIRRIDVPLSEPGTPEIIALAPGQSMPGADSNDVRYYFLVPEGVTSFWVDIPTPSLSVNRSSIWNPDGERAWDWNYYAPAYDGPEPMRAVVTVPPEHSNKLWHITVPRRGRGFTMDPQIPPFYSVDPDRWFFEKSH